MRDAIRALERTTHNLPNFRCQTARCARRGSWAATAESLKLIGKQTGLTGDQVESCLKDQALLDKIAADQKYANDVLKVNSTPTFFINGEMVKGVQTFEEFDKRINSLLKS